MSQFMNLVGLKSGRLEVIECFGKNRHGQHTWRCRCECGNTCVVVGGPLRSGGTKSCGCLRIEQLIQRTRVDITGQRFGRLVAIELVGVKRRSCTWLCQCDCGNQKVMVLGDIQSGRTQSCGCLNREKISQRSRIDITGQRFGRWYVEKEFGTKDSQVFWQCRCDCGNTRVISTHSLRSGGTHSCGCLKSEQASQRFSLDLTGQRFGRLVAIEQVGRKGNCLAWSCQCDCGKTHIVSSRHLRSGRIKSCGCFNREQASKRQTLDLTGQQFGRLVAIKRVGKKGSSYVWLCRCDCGETSTVRTGALRNGGTRSCGCLRSDVTRQRVRKDITGQRFGRLIVLHSLEVRKESQPDSVLWLCQCDCGNSVVASTTHLIRGGVRSCGCLQAEHRQALGKNGPKFQAIIRELMEQSVTQEQLQELIPLIRGK